MSTEYNEQHYSNNNSLCFDEGPTLNSLNFIYSVESSQVRIVIALYGTLLVGV